MDSKSETYRTSQYIHCVQTKGVWLYMARNTPYTITSQVLSKLIVSRLDLTKDYSLGVLRAMPYRAFFLNN